MLHRLLWLPVVLWLASTAASVPLSAQEALPVNAQIVADATLELRDLGAVQGVSEHDGKFYVYGDLVLAEPRVGMIREFDRDFKPTGRFIRLAVDDKPLISHPTGLTWSASFGAILGDTVAKQATIYRLDWNKALEQGHLTGAVLATIIDDAAVQGCRPLFVTLDGKEWLATADYGDVRPELRLLDPKALLEAKRTSEPGVIGHRVSIGPFNQNLAWDAKAKRLTCIQNTSHGKGWRLDVIDLEKAVAAGRVDAPPVRIERLTFAARTELEGYTSLDEDRGVFVTAAMLQPNLTIGRIERTNATAPAKSPAP